ncbi:MAG: glycosyltransferase family 39 protein [Hyphomicrobiales bacterium]|nr:glycosyltransferase family 39 protein [Hyphomicrobiales bacterium]
MSFARQGAADRTRSPIGDFFGRLGRAAERFIDDTPEHLIVLVVLVGFVVLWMIFWTVSTAPIDIHIDADEAIIWARHFAFGYKHPPVTAWTFMLWFAVFPQQKWAVDLLVVVSDAVALAVTWRLLRDHLDKNRALLGLFALILIPLYTVKAEVLNANTVMIPFWAATLLFYLRARRGLGAFDAFLAGAFASLTVLGKYWAVFLLAGMAVAAVTGPGARRFWRSSAPYVMAAGALVFIAPHVWWLVSERGGGAIQFAESVVTRGPFGDTLMKTVSYLVGAAMYIAAPLIFFAALRPSKAALADIAWPAEDDRRQALVLLMVPLILPALVNLFIPYRITPDWTFPNWALLPVVLYGSPYLAIDTRATARAGLAGLAIVLAIVLASPVIAGVRIVSEPDQFRPHFRQAAELASKLSGQPVQFYGGSDAIVGGMQAYLPQARHMPLPLTAEGRAAVSAKGLVIVCLASDPVCRKIAEATAPGTAPTTMALTRSFLGFSGPPLDVQVVVVPPDAAGKGS